MNFLYVFLRMILWPIQRIFWPTKVVGKENFFNTEGPAILICNHYSTVDEIIISTHLFKKRICALVKAEEFDNKTAAYFLYKLECIPVRRGEADLKAAKAVMAKLSEGRKVLVFPEGTRNKAGTKELQEIKQGVAMFSMRTNVPVIPMLYYQMHKVGRKNYAVIGKPFMVTDGFDHKPTLAEGTAYIRSKMEELRVEVNELAANKGKIKKEDKVKVD